VSSAAGSGSDNPFAGYDLHVHGSHDDQPDAVFHFLDEYVESVSIDEQPHEGGEDGWCDESSVDEDARSTSSSVVGITPTELESFNELIKFDHMYYRQPSKNAEVYSSEEPIDHSKTESFEVVSEVACESEAAELASDDELNLESFSESDLAQLTNCFDWLIDSSGNVLGEDRASQSQDITSCPASLDDIESSCLSEHIDSLIPFTDDFFISTNNFDCSIDKQNSHNFTFGLNFETTSVENLVKTNELDTKKNSDLIKKEVGENKKYESTLVGDSLENCSSPCSSSGCESDFSASTFEDDPFSFSTDIGLTDFTDEPFTELFPALY